MSGEDLLGRTIAGGRYELVRLLGEGGMGAVYQAKQVAMDRLVALKLIRAEMVTSQQAVARFHQEMRATSKIEHPNTIRVYDFGETDGQLFLAMEFLAGETLRQVLERGALQTERVLHIGAQIARALGAAHSEGIVHRDLKPDNVMLLDRYGERDFVKVLDFGIARSLDENRTQMTAAGAIIGTPAYMSPEQAAGQALDTRSDLYSLGVMLYEMASGRPPFAGETVVSLLVAHMSEAPKPVGELQPSVPAPLAQTIMQLLAKSPADRPQAAAEVATRLEALANATVPPTIEQARPGAVPGRSKLPFVIGGVLLAGGIGAAIAFLPKHGGGENQRLALDRLLTANADPATPATCKTTDGETLSLLIGALNANGDSERVAILNRANAGSAERAALLARAQLESAPAEAFASAKKAVELCPGYAYAYNLQGKAAQKWNRLDDAEIAYDNAVKAAPDYLAPRFNLGLIQLKRNDAKDASEQFSAILKQDPAYRDAWLMRARARLATGHVDEGLADLEQATQRVPSAETWLMLGDVRSKTGKGDAEAAFCEAKKLGSAEAAARCKR